LTTIGIKPFVESYKKEELLWVEALAAEHLELELLHVGHGLRLVLRVKGDLELGNPSR